eukprot:3231279-Amphidinium_carterae.1
MVPNTVQQVRSKFSIAYLLPREGAGSATETLKAIHATCYRPQDWRASSGLLGPLPLKQDKF